MGLVITHATSKTGFIHHIEIKKYLDIIGSSLIRHVIRACNNTQAPVIQRVDSTI